MNSQSAPLINTQTSEKQEFFDPTQLPLYLIALSLIPSTYIFYYSQAQAGAIEESKQTRDTATWISLIVNIPLTVHFSLKYFPDIKNIYCDIRYNPENRAQKILLFVLCCITGLSANAIGYVGEIKAYDTLGLDYKEQSFESYANIYFLLVMMLFFAIDLYKIISNYFFSTPQQKNQEKLQGLFNTWDEQSDITSMNKWLNGLKEAIEPNLEDNSLEMQQKHLQNYLDTQKYLDQEGSLWRSSSWLLDYSAFPYYFNTAPLSAITCFQKTTPSWICTALSPLNWLGTSYKSGWGGLSYIANITMFFFYANAGKDGICTFYDNVQKLRKIYKQCLKSFIIETFKVCASIGISLYSVFPSLFQMSEGSTLLNNPIAEFTNSKYGTWLTAFNVLWVNYPGTALLCSSILELLTTTLDYFNMISDTIKKEQKLATIFKRATEEALKGNDANIENIIKDIASYKAIGQ